VVSPPPSVELVGQVVSRRAPRKELCVSQSWPRFSRSSRFPGGIVNSAGSRTRLSWSRLRRRIGQSVFGHALRRSRFGTVEYVRGPPSANERITGKSYSLRWYLTSRSADRSVAELSARGTSHQVGHQRNHFRLAAQQVLQRSLCQYLINCGLQRLPQRTN
jgi:hypothetical protein